MTPESPAPTPTYAGILAETIDALLRAAREMSSPKPNFPALQETVVNCAQVLMAVRIGVAKLEGATACPPPFLARRNAAAVLKGTVVDLAVVRSALRDVETRA